MEPPINQVMYLCGRYGNTFYHHLFIKSFLIEKSKIQFIIIKIKFFIYFNANRT
jgi:hypothetical protein